MRPSIGLVEDVTRWSGCQNWYNDSTFRSHSWSTISTVTGCTLLSYSQAVQSQWFSLISNLPRMWLYLCYSDLATTMCNEARDTEGQPVLAGMEDQVC